MKLLEKNFAPNKQGTVDIIPEEPDDLLVIYNLITVGDVVTTVTTRKVHLESKRYPIRVKLTIPLQVTHQDYDEYSTTIRVKGRNTEKNEYVEAGSSHTLTIELKKPFQLYKNSWDSTSVSALSKSPKYSPSGTDLAVVLIQENQAEVHLVGNLLTTLRCKIKASKTKKKSAGSKFFQELFDAVVKNVDFRCIKSVLIASVGSTKDRFRTYLISESKRLRMKTIEENESRIVVTECTNEWDDLKEVLNINGVMDLIRDSKVGMELRTLQKLRNLLDNDSDRACYGFKDVEAAHKMGGIDTLLITERLHKSSHKYKNLATSVKNGGGKVLVYSSISAPQLSNLTGIAAILWFPLHSLYD